MSDRAWVQFLFVAVPVLSLVGSWLALRVAGARKGRSGPKAIDGGRRAAGEEDGE